MVGSDLSQRSKYLIKIVLGENEIEVNLATVEGIDCLYTAFQEKTIPDTQWDEIREKINYDRLDPNKNDGSRIIIRLSEMDLLTNEVLLKIVQDSEIALYVTQIEARDGLRNRTLGELNDENAFVESFGLSVLNAIEAKGNLPAYIKELIVRKKDAYLETCAGALPQHIEDALAISPNTKFGFECIKKALRDKTFTNRSFAIWGRLVDPRTKYGARSAAWLLFAGHNDPTFIDRVTHLLDPNTRKGQLLVKALSSQHLNGPIRLSADNVNELVAKIDPGNVHGSKCIKHLRDLLTPDHNLELFDRKSNVASPCADRTTKGNIPSVLAVSHMRIIGSEALTREERLMTSAIGHEVARDFYRPARGKE